MTTAASTKKPTTAAAVPAPDTTPAPAAAASTGLSITSLVLAIVGIALGQGLVSVAAVIVAFVARTREPAGRLTANWGLVLGFAGLFGGLILGILGVAAFMPLWFLGGIGAWDVWGF